MMVMLGTDQKDPSDCKDKLSDTTIIKPLIPNKLGLARNETQSESIEIRDLKYKINDSNSDNENDNNDDENDNDDDDDDNHFILF
jgi:hypothetical protein